MTPTPIPWPTTGSGLNHPHHTHLDSQRNLALAFVFNLTFAIIEFFGGLWAGSVSVLSNALHDAGDALSLGLGYFLQRRSEDGPSEKFSYGLRRLSFLSAIISGVVICAGALFVAYEAFDRIWHPGEPRASGMLLLAVMGIAVNGLAAWKLGHGHTHNEKVLKLAFDRRHARMGRSLDRWNLHLLVRLAMGRCASRSRDFGFRLFQCQPASSSRPIALFLQGNPDPTIFTCIFAISSRLFPK